MAIRLKRERKKLTRIENDARWLISQERLEVASRELCDEIDNQFKLVKKLERFDEILGKIKNKLWVKHDN